MGGVADQREAFPDEAARKAKAQREGPRLRSRRDLPEPTPEPIFELALEIMGSESDQRLCVGVRLIPDNA